MKAVMLQDLTTATEILGVQCLLILILVTAASLEVCILLDMI